MALFLKIRLIFGLIVTVLVIAFCAYAGAPTSLTFGFGASAFLISQVLLSPAFIQQQKEKEARRRHYDEIRREAYAQRQGELDADDRYANKYRGGNGLTGPSMFDSKSDTFGHFGFSKRKRR